MHAPAPATAAAPGRAAALAGAALLAGCAAAPLPNLPAYAAPAADQPAARLLMRAQVHPNDRFMLVVLDDNERCQGPRLLAGGAPGADAAPQRIAAGRLTTLDFVIARGGQTPCVVRWSFTPMAGRTYLAQGLVVGAGCTARLLDASQPDRPLQPPDLLLRSTPAQRCVPLALSARSGVSPIQGGQHDGEAVLNPNATAKDLEGLIRP